MVFGRIRLRHNVSDLSMSRKGSCPLWELLQCNFVLAQKEYLATRTFEISS